MAAAVPGLHLVTDDRILADPAFPSAARAALEAGGGWVALHVRGPRTDGGPLLATARALVSAARAAGACVVVNDRVDVALAAVADGAHLGRRSLPVAAARRLLGPAAWIGASTHTDAEVAEAAAEGADWVFVGTIHATPGHPPGSERGAGALASARAVAAGVPVIAIGGVTPARVAEAVAAGAAGVAVVRGVWSAADPAAAVHEYLRALARATGTAGERP